MNPFFKVIQHTIQSFRPNLRHRWKLAFFHACSHGHLQRVQLLCNPKFQFISDIHADEEWGVRVACSEGHLDVVRFLTTSANLISFGHSFANIDTQNQHGFFMACLNGHLDVVKFLTTSSDFYQAGHAPLNLYPGFEAACRGGHLPIVTFLTTSPDLIDAGYSRFDIHAHHEQAFSIACYNGHLDVVQFLTSSPSLRHAGHVPVDIEVKLYEAFRLACKNNHSHVVRHFIFDLNIPLNPTIQSIIQHYPEAQDFFRIREEQVLLSQALPDLLTPMTPNFKPHSSSPNPRSALRL